MKTLVSLLALLALAAPASGPNALPSRASELDGSESRHRVLHDASLWRESEVWRGWRRL